jgi:hypothetical protein
VPIVVDSFLQSPHNYSPSRQHQHLAFPFILTVDTFRRLSTFFLAFVWVEQRQTQTPFTLSLWVRRTSFLVHDFGLKLAPSQRKSTIASVSILYSHLAVDRLLYTSFASSAPEQTFPTSLIIGLVGRHLHLHPHPGSFTLNSTPAFCCAPNMRPAPTSQEYGLVNLLSEHTPKAMHSLCIEFANVFFTTGSISLPCQQ